MSAFDPLEEARIRDRIHGKRAPDYLSTDGCEWCTDLGRGFVEMKVKMEKMRTAIMLVRNYGVPAMLLFDEHGDKVDEEDHSEQEDHSDDFYCDDDYGDDDYGDERVTNEDIYDHYDHKNDGKQKTHSPLTPAKLLSIHRKETRREFARRKYRRQKVVGGDDESEEYSGDEADYKDYDEWCDYPPHDFDEYD